MAADWCCCEPFMVEVYTAALQVATQRDESRTIRRKTQRRALCGGGMEEGVACESKHLSRGCCVDDLAADG